MSKYMECWKGEFSKKKGIAISHPFKNRAIVRAAVGLVRVGFKIVTTVH